MPVKHVSRVNLAPLATYPVRTYGPFGPVAIPDNVTDIVYIVGCDPAQGELTDPASSIIIHPKLSVDGGSWEAAGDVTIPGAAQHIGKGGVVLTEIPSGGGLTVGINRQYMIESVEVIGAPIKTFLDVEITVG